MTDFARAWAGLGLALGLHVLDEALTGFLPVWNATVQALRTEAPWLILPTFRFEVWLAGLTCGVILLLAATPFVNPENRLTRIVAAALALLMIANALGHTVATVFGHTLPSVRFSRPAPGFWSAPVLLAAAILLLRELYATRNRTANAGSPSALSSAAGSKPA